MRRRLIGVVMTLGLCACGGGGGSSLPPASGHLSAPQKSAVTFSLVVPGHTSSNARIRRAQSVAENTMGIEVVVSASSDPTTPLATVTADISAGNATNCTSDSNGDGGRNCTFPLTAPYGNDTFVVTTYDKTPQESGGFGDANELGYGVATQDVETATCRVGLTLSSVVASIGLALSPAVMHTLIPATSTLSMYALDADSDVIIADSLIDSQGNPVTENLSIDGDATSSFSLSSTSLSAPSASGVQLSYAGGAISGETVGILATSTSPFVSGVSVALSVVPPTFSQINDQRLDVNDPYHGGIAFDSTGGVYYTTPDGFGGVSYYGGPSNPYLYNAQGSGSNPIRGGITGDGEGDFYTVAGSRFSEFSGTFDGGIGPGPNETAAPIPNGSAMAFDSSSYAVWYTSGSNLVEYPISGGTASVYPIGTNVAAGLAIDASSNVWVVDTANDQLIGYPNGVTTPLQAGGAPYDLLVNANGIFVTDHGSNPGIVKLTTGGSYVCTITIPGGGTPWYLMADNAQPGIVWFDYVNGGNIGVGRMDTNVTPALVTTALYASGPAGSQAGAIGAASNGLMYMVFSGTNTLVQVER